MCIRDRDYIVTNNLSEIEQRTSAHPRGEELFMIKFLAIEAGLLRARIRRGRYYGGDFTAGLRYVRDRKVDLVLPHRAKAFARRYAHAGPTFCILPGGSAGSVYY